MSVPDHRATAPVPGLDRGFRLVRALARLVFQRILRWRIDVGGLEHVPTAGGAVLAFNHHSYVDFVMAAWDVVIRLGRPVRFLAKREVWQSKARIIVALAGAVPVDRGDASSRQGAYAEAVAALRRGELVAVAPEQTISPSFELLPFRTGAVRMAQQAGVPIVPVVGWGSQRFAAKGQGFHLRLRLPVTVRYGDPIHVAPDEDPVAATELLRDRMVAMLDEVQRGYPDTPTPGDDWWVPARLGGSAPDHAEVLAEHQRRFEERRGGPGEAPGSERR